MLIWNRHKCFYVAFGVKRTALNVMRQQLKSLLVWRNPPVMGTGGSASWCILSVPLCLALIITVF